MRKYEENLSNRSHNKWSKWGLSGHGRGLEASKRNLQAASPGRNLKTSFDLFDFVNASINHGVNKAMKGVGSQVG